MGLKITACCCSERDKYTSAEPPVSVRSTQSRPASLPQGIQKPTTESSAQKSDRREGRQSLNSSVLSCRSTQSTPGIYGNTLVEFDSEPELVLRTEKKVKWQKTELIRLFDEMAYLKTYKRVLNEPAAKLFVSEKGTPTVRTSPMFKTEYYMPPRFTLDQVVGAMHTSEKRLLWDKNLESQRVVRRNHRVELIHIQQKSHSLMQQKRDIFEKKIGFTYRPPACSSSQAMSTGYNEFAKVMASSDRMENYFFFSSIDPKLSMVQCPPDGDTVRSHIYFGMHKFELVPLADEEGEEGLQVKATFLLQMDPQLDRLKMGLYKVALPTFTRQFYQSLVEFLDSQKQ